MIWCWFKEIKLGDIQSCTVILCNNQPVLCVLNLQQWRISKWTFNVSTLSAPLNEPDDALLYDGEQLSSLSHSSPNNTVLNMLMFVIINYQHSALLFLCKPSIFFLRCIYHMLIIGNSINWFNLILTVHCFMTKQNKSNCFIYKYSLLPKHCVNLSGFSRHNFYSFAVMKTKQDLLRHVISYRQKRRKTWVAQTIIILLN